MRSALGAQFAAKIQHLPTDQLIAYVQNVKQHPDSQIDKLVSSIAEFGFTVPLIIDQHNVVIAGHGRLAAALKMQLAKVPCIVRDDLSPAQIKAYRIADNKLAESPWDADALRLELEQLAELDFDLTLTGWDEDDLAAFDIDIDFESGQIFGERDRPEEDEDALAETLEEAESGETDPRVSPGEIWQLGRHRICCDDALSEDNLKRLLGDRSPDMVWADPPYGISIVAANGYVGGGEAYDIPFGGVQNKGYVGGGNCNRTSIAECQRRKNEGLGSTNGAKPFGSRAVRGSVGASNIVAVNKYEPIVGDDTTETAISAYRLTANLYPAAISIWWGANYYASALPDSSCWLIWDKENTGNFADAEMAWCSHKSAVRIFRHMWNGMVKASERGERRVHPTQKPVALAEWAFDKYGKYEALILDPFLGSGMSVLAAEKTDRAVYGFELSPAYCEVIIRRWEKYTGREAVKLSG